jgi:hypothetical protein
VSYSLSPNHEQLPDDVRATGGNITHQPRLAQATESCVHVTLRVLSVYEHAYQICNSEVSPGA